MIHLLFFLIYYQKQPIIEVNEKNEMTVVWEKIKPQTSSN
ncbi:hypothetical protein CDIMF43_160007 [Carnobacterium divergens]|nr:hypothetical protein CDIV41_230157 [Carnobacterium divergens]SPC39680.1 hypothetical protein CDIMF43_160007 [Carnobacterium divergens]